MDWSDLEVTVESQRHSAVDMKTKPTQNKQLPPETTGAASHSHQHMSAKPMI